MYVVSIGKQFFSVLIINTLKLFNLFYTSDTFSDKPSDNINTENVFHFKFESIANYFYKKKSQ